MKAITAAFYPIIKRLREGRKLKAFSSSHYWLNRYSKGGNSGPGSYEHLAAFKSDALNRFIEKHSIKTVIEFGCGDGNQLRYANYHSYIGYDISPNAIALCRRMFLNDPSKHFATVNEYDGQQAELSISLDVIFHLVEDDIFNEYMQRLFDASVRYVAVYSSDTEDNTINVSPHVKHRKFTSWISRNRPNWRLIEKIPNKYPYNGDFTKTSFSDFFFFEKF